MCHSVSSWQKKELLHPDRIEDILIATMLGISRAFYNVSSAATWCFFPTGTRTLDTHYPRLRTEPKHFTVPPKWVPFSTKVAYRLFEGKKIFAYAKDYNVSGVPDGFRVEVVVSRAEAMAVKTSMEVEGEWLKD
jgi:hypothetical protein